MTQLEPPTLHETLMAPLATAEDVGRRPRAVTALGMLLLAQSFSLTSFAGVTALQYLADTQPTAQALLGWLQGLPGSPLVGLSPDWRELLIDLPLALLALVAAVGFFRLRPGAWLYAMLVQGVILFSALVSYFNGAPTYIRMGVSIFIVLYLNNDEVQRAFRPPSPARLDGLPEQGL